MNLVIFMILFATCCHGFVNLGHLRHHRIFRHGFRRFAEEESDVFPVPNQNDNDISEQLEAELKSLLTAIQARLMSKLSKLQYNIEPVKEVQEEDSSRDPEGTLTPFGRIA